MQEQQQPRSAYDTDATPTEAKAPRRRRAQMDTSREDAPEAQRPRPSSTSRAAYVVRHGEAAERPLGEGVSRGRRAPGKRRVYVLRRHSGLMLRGVTAGVLLTVVIVALIQLTAYQRQLESSRRTSEQLREIYYAALAEETPTPAPVRTPAPTRAAAHTPTASPTPAPVPELLEGMAYPKNPSASVQSRFVRLQRQNADIIGWLTIPEVLDEAVVQRDNSYYLRRDYRGYHNDNGALFLEEACTLTAGRPYTLLIYGHNMRAGTMFGCLRNYESIGYYKKNAFITFDTAYEDGRYVIFAVGTLDQRPGSAQYVDVSRLLSVRRAWREETLDALVRLSVMTTSLEVRSDDQILILMTCAEGDTQRRYVAARRLREDESEEKVKQAVQKSRSK